MFTSLATDKSGGSGVSGMASWFSSLRRQPKNKKPQDKKSLQKSCVDLTTSNIYHDLPPTRTAVANPTSKSNASDIRIEDTASKCTCDITTTTNVETTRLKTKVKTSDRHAIPKINTDTATTTTETSSQSIYSVRHKEEFRTVTTTKITKTTVVNRQKTHRVGLIFDEDGELMNSNLDLWQLVSRCKSPDRLIFDQSGNLMPTGDNGNNFNHHNNSNNNNNNNSFNNNNLNNTTSDKCDFKPINLMNGENIEFIDCTNAGDDIYNTDQATTQCKNCKNKSKSNFAKAKSETHLNQSNKQIKDELCEVVSEMEQHDTHEDNKHSNKDKQMTIGRKKFNMDPKKGIEYLYENHLLRTDPKDVAQFLYKGEGLNKTAIGDYLGEKNDFNEAVLKAFVELHDFTNLILVEALRQFLWSFRLPGEAQKIDRMMECFAQRYCHLNPDIFTNTDTCYVLSFAIIMLNTSLHNPSVKDKPTVEQFISMNRGINNGGDLPRELLESLYESIRTEPFKIPQDDGNDLMHTFFNPDKEGWLWKQGGRYKSWKRRWFILNDNCLYYFEYTTDKEPRGIIPLENISVREITDRNKPHCFELYACGGADIIKACKTDSEGKVVEGKHTVYRMSAATDEEKQEWIKCLQQSISHNPFYDILVQRKKKALAKS